MARSDTPRSEAKPGPGVDERLIDLPAASSIEDHVERLDIGASRFEAGPRHGFDIDIADLPALLQTVARAADSETRPLYVQLPGRCLRLTSRDVAARLSDIEGRPRLRLLATDRGGQIAENVAIELWKQASRAYRSLSDDAHVRLTIPGAPPPLRGAVPTERSVDVPIDIVYTWVDAENPAWRELAAPHLDLTSLEDDLYRQTDELRYSLRSVETFAPWVNHVYVLSNCSPPEWFSSTSKVTWVDHGDVAPPEILPLFNSAAIDTLLHRIPGLEEHFLYLNDDFMLWDGAVPSDFYTWDGRSVSRMASNSSLIYLQQLVDAGEARPSQHARVNTARLLHERSGIFGTRVHGHVPYALLRSVMERMEQDFADQVAATRSSRTRSERDVTFVAYLYHYYAYLNAAAVHVDAPQSFVTLQNYQRPAMRRALEQTPFICLQDSRGSAGDADYQAFKRKTLEAALPLPSAAERPEQ